MDGRSFIELALKLTSTVTSVTVEPLIIKMLMFSCSESPPAGAPGSG